MLTKEQDDLLNSIISDTVNEIRNIFDNILPSMTSAAEVVASLLTYLHSINDPKQIKKVMKDYPEAEKQIKLIGHLRFPETALSTLNNYGEFVRTSKQLNDKILGEDIAEKSIEQLSNWLDFQMQTMIPSAILLDSIISESKGTKKEIEASRKRVDRLHTKDKKLKKETLILERKMNETQKKTDELQKQFNLSLGIITADDRKHWIDQSTFKTDLESVQNAINRLNSRFVYGGRAKSAKLKEAFNNALDASVQGKIATFEDFLNYKKPGFGFFSKGEPSLKDVLEKHRHELWDKLTGKKTTKGLGRK